jgi:hypothetical protein
MVSASWLRCGDIANHLADNTFDCIVIGAAVRMTTKHVGEFEQVVDAVRRGAPHTPIAPNSSPDSRRDAAARWLRLFVVSSSSRRSFSGWWKVLLRVGRESSNYFSTESMSAQGSRDTGTLCLSEWRRQESQVMMGRCLVSG